MLKRHIECAKARSGKRHDPRAAIEVQACGLSWAALLRVVGRDRPDKLSRQLRAGLRLCRLGEAECAGQTTQRQYSGYEPSSSERHRQQTPPNAAGG